MKLILNNKTNEPIAINNLSRNLTLEDPEVSFDVYFSNDDRTTSASSQYLAQYEEQVISAYAILDNDNEPLLEVSNVEARLVSFSENYTDTFYSASGHIQVLQ